MFKLQKTFLKVKHLTRLTVTIANIKVMLHPLEIYLSFAKRKGAKSKIEILDTFKLNWLLCGKNQVTT